MERILLMTTARHTHTLSLSLCVCVCAEARPRRDDGLFACCPFVGNRWRDVRTRRGSERDSEIHLRRGSGLSLRCNWVFTCVASVPVSCPWHRAPLSLPKVGARETASHARTADQCVEGGDTAEVRGDACGVGSADRITHGCFGFLAGRWESRGEGG
ncbi:hypothetical protein B0J12DRAFT_637566 [Macrophomina phaseolina]|uniref:Secreted protein n=1 Tax=Macrophomina phaseolina TaxID=35725 RepID=A0ABQ8GTX3_9PEZI|nr:hypothetical protein B0J12DRAFT_637566 [Macrophomina phaseolina]